MKTLKIVAISDVHGKWNKFTIPECDLLISAGDYSHRGEEWMVKDFHEWLNKQPAKHIISVQGNHELWVESNFQEAKEVAEKACPRVHFIDEGPLEIEGVKIWCSAWTPFFFNWAWNARRFEEIKKHWDLIPLDTKILVTHGPPHGILDEVYRVDGTKRDNVGCEELMIKVREVKPDLHIFGHIHGSSGEKHLNGTSFYNAACLDEMYMASNPPKVIEYIIED